MAGQRGFLGGFFVLGVTLFVAGFLLGMLFLGVVHVSSDTASLGFMSFALGFITGMLTISLILVVMRSGEIHRAT